jgi:hypothetical protein
VQIASAAPPAAGPTLGFRSQTAAASPGTRYVTVTPEVQSSFPIETQLHQLQTLQTQLQHLRNQAMQGGLQGGLPGGPPGGMPAGMPAGIPGGMPGGVQGGIPVGGVQLLWPHGANYLGPNGGAAGLPSCAQQVRNAPPGNLPGGGAHGTHGARGLHGLHGRVPGGMQGGMQGRIPGEPQAGLPGGPQGGVLQIGLQGGLQSRLQGGSHAGLQGGLQAGLQAGLQGGLQVQRNSSVAPQESVSAALADVEAELEAQLRLALGGSSQLPSPSQPMGNSSRFSTAEIAAYGQLAAPFGTSSGHVQTDFGNPEGQFSPQDQIYADLADQAEADLALDQDGADPAEDQAGAETLPTNALTGSGATSTNKLGGNLTTSAEVWKSSHATGGVADESLDISQASSLGTVVAGDNAPASTLTAPTSAAATTNEEQQPMPADDMLEARSAPAPHPLHHPHRTTHCAIFCIARRLPTPPLPAPGPRANLLHRPFSRCCTQGTAT